MNLTERNIVKKNVTIRSTAKVTKPTTNWHRLSRPVQHRWYVEKQANDQKNNFMLHDRNNLQRTV